LSYRDPEDWKYDDYLYTMLMISDWFSQLVSSLVKKFAASYSYFCVSVYEIEL